MIVVPIVISTLVVGSRVLVMPNSSGVLARKPLSTRGDHHRRHHFGDHSGERLPAGAGVDMSQLATVDISKYQSLRKRYKAVPTALWARFCRWCDEYCGVDGERRNAADHLLLVLFGLGLSSLPATHREPLVTCSAPSLKPCLK